MHRLYARLRDRRGAAMIIVMCIMCVFAVISLALLLSASLLASNAVKAAAREQSRISAVSMSQALGAYITGEEPEGELTHKDNALCEYLREEIGNAIYGTSGWPYYCEDEGGHDNLGTVQKKLDLSLDEQNSDNVGEFTINMHWISDAESIAEYNTAVADYIAVENRNELIAPTPPCELVVSVKCTYRGQTYVVDTSYFANAIIPNDVTDPTDMSVIKWWWY